jgi:hypothetical protein
MMKKFNFEQDDPWKYDHFHVITNMKHAVGLQYYVHHLDATKRNIGKQKFMDISSTVTPVPEHKYTKEGEHPKGPVKDTFPSSSVINIEDDQVNKVVDFMMETLKKRILQKS